MEKKVKIEKLFLIISLFIGSLLVLLVPPFNSPDEETHFLYAYEISQGNIFTKVNDNISGHYVPVAILNSISKNHEIAGNIDKKYSYSEMYADNLYSEDYSDKAFYIIPVQTQPIIAYIAPAIGIKIASSMSALFGTGYVKTEVLLEFARFFSLIVYSIIGFFAIRITPKFKKSFFGILLLPMSMFLRSMVTYDGLILVLTALVLAVILRIINDKNIRFNKKYLLFFIITGFILLNVKTVYSIVFFGVFALPNEFFGGKKNKIKKIIEMLLIVLLISALRKIIINYIVIGTDNSLIKEQLNFVLKHPIKYIIILFRNMRGKIVLHSWWMLGTYGYLDTCVPVLFQFMLKIYLIFLIINDVFYEQIEIPKWLRIGYLLLVFLSIVAVFTSMYIIWTSIVTNEIGGSIIEGVQGRYYLPYLFLLPIIFNNSLVKKIKNKYIKNILNRSNEIFNNNYHYFTIFSLVFLVIIIIIRYYV